MDREHLMERRYKRLAGELRIADAEPLPGHRSVKVEAAVVVRLLITTTQLDQEIACGLVEVNSIAGWPSPCIPLHGLHVASEQALGFLPTASERQSPHLIQELVDGLDSERLVVLPDALVVQGEALVAGQPQPCRPKAAVPQVQRCPPIGRWRIICQSLGAKAYGSPRHAHLTYDSLAP
jgi:hypothetical protein